MTNELAVIFCLRDAANDPTAPAELLEEWRRHTLPLFLDRMATRLGDSTCSTGTHQDWPAASRHDRFSNNDAVRERHDLFHVDTHPPQQLRPTAAR